MFTLLAKLAEILSAYGTRFLDGRTTRGDTAVAAELAGCLVALQDVCVRGDRVLRSVDELAAGAGTPAELELLITAQLHAVQALQAQLQERQALLATVDPGLYVELAPLLDAKSGLLTRWRQQAAQSLFSTTTLFFLPRDDLERVLRAVPADSTDFLLVVTDAVRDLRSGELRDVRQAVTQQGDGLASEVRTARADLDRATALCAALLASTERAVGPEALARLRRDLAKRLP